MDQVSIKYTNIFLSKALQNLPKFGFLVWKQTIWQPCREESCLDSVDDRSKKNLSDYILALS
jgi:hypothetical protein